MNILLLYMVKAAAYIAGFYIVYFTFLSQDANYLRNRIFLLTSLVLPFVMPLITFPVLQENTIYYLGKTLSEIYVTAEGASGIAGTAEGEGPGLMVTIFRIYIAGVIVFGIKLMADILSLEFMIMRKKREGLRVIRFKGYNTAGFSAMGYIFLNQMLTPAEEEEIIKHEQNHMEQLHFIDILLLEIVKVFQWFNPFIYMMNRSLRAVHEYQADAGCLRSGLSVAGYQTLLLTHLLRSKIFLSSNSFSNPSLIRKRMLMMSKSKSRAAANLKLLFVIPMALLILLIISAFEINRNNLRNSENIVLPDNQGTPAMEISGPAVFHKPAMAEDISPPPSREPPAETRSVPVKQTAAAPETELQKAEVQGEVFVVVEEMPAYPGGDKAMMEFIYGNMQYPPAAKEKGIEGRVILRFAIMANGSVDKITVIRGADPDLDNEAKRVVSLLEPWKPGRQGGKAVNVWYSVPITFQLK